MIVFIDLFFIRVRVKRLSFDERAFVVCRRVFFLFEIYIYCYCVFDECVYRIVF